MDEPVTMARAVLEGISTYQAPPYPRDEQLSRETYDYRIESGAALPPTLVDTLICDLWQRLSLDLKRPEVPAECTHQQLAQGINIYLTRDWADIAGYRPWTHWSYIRGLNHNEREKLAKETTQYILAHGVLDPTIAR